MKSFRLSILLFLICLLAVNGYSQRMLRGKVVEIIDGKTAAVEIQSSGILKVVLQFIETPEPEQPLHAAVKEHLEKLILGKEVRVLPQAIAQAKTVGQIFLGDTDVSQQMIRDGAAWYALPEKNGQNAADSLAYQNNESQAKAEKRGIWSVENLKTAWQFRAEKEERLRAEERARQEAFQAKIKAEKEEYKPKPQLAKSFVSAAGYTSVWEAADMGSAIWSETKEFGNLGIPNADGLIVNRNEQYNSKLIMTTPTYLEMKAKNEVQKLQSGFGYLYFKELGGKPREGFGMALKAVSEKETFKTLNNLTFVADGKKISVGKAVQLGEQSDKTFQEMLVYTLNRDVLAAVATAEKVEIKVGNYSTEMPEKLHAMIKSLIIESTR